MGYGVELGRITLNLEGSVVDDEGSGQWKRMSRKL